MEDLKAIVGADISQLKKGMADAQKELAKTAVAAGKLDSTLSRAAKGSNQATFALTNLGRVAQDAQFGFMGIANNLNPLLESFQRLQKESGGTRGALKALTGSLMGAGGIGFALSLAIPIVGFMTSGFGAWTRGLKSNKTALDESAKATKQIADEIASLKSVVDVIATSTASVQGEIALVNVLAKTILDTNKSYEERSNALQRLKPINEAYFGDLTLEASKLETLTALVNEYTAALIQQSIIKGFESEIGAVTQAIFKQQQVIKGYEKDLVKTQKEAAKELVYAAQQGATQLAGLRARQAASVTDATRKQFDANKALNKQVEILEKLDIQYTDLRRGIEDAVATSLRLKPLKLETAGKAKAVKDIETLNEFLAKMEAQLIKINKIELLRGINKSLDKIQLFESSIDQIFDKFKLAADDPIIINLQFRANEIKLTEFSKQILSFTKEDKELKIDVPFEINLKPVFNKGGGKTLIDQIDKERMISELRKNRIYFDLNDIFITDFSPLDAVQAAFKKLTEHIESLKSKLENLGAIVNFDGLTKQVLTVATAVTNILAPAFDSFFDTLTNGGKYAFQSFAQALGQMIKKLVLAVIKSIALSAIVSLITGKAFNIPAIVTRAITGGMKEGGPVRGPGSSTSDQVFARLSAGEYVMSAASVSKFGQTFFDMLNHGFMPPKMNTGGSVGGGSIGGSQLITVNVIGRAKGKDLFFTNERAAATLGRNG